MNSPLYINIVSFFFFVLYHSPVEREREERERERERERVRERHTQRDI